MVSAPCYPVFTLFLLTLQRVTNKRPLTRKWSGTSLIEIEARFLDVLLTVHLSINLVNDPTRRAILLFYNTFITVLYMFRAMSCSSSGGQIELIQHLV